MARGAGLVLTALALAGCAEPPGPEARGVVPRSVGMTPPPVRGYVAGRTLGTVRIDGSLEDPSWAEAPWTEPFVDIEGDRRPAPRWRTRVAMVWDDHALYVAAVLEEPHLWGTITERDAVIFHDNDFEVFLDPDGDTHAYYELEINALGTVWDLLLDRPYRDGGRAVNDWDIAGLASAVELQGTLNDPADVDTGWTVELAIPWTGLADLEGRQEAPPRDGEQWRVNFSRVQWHLDQTDTGYVRQTGPDGELRSEENWVWSPQDAINMHMPEMWGVVQFSTRPVGTAPASLSPVDGGDARWLLRRLYYAQREAREATGEYLGDALPLGFPSEVIVERTGADGYRATVTGADGAWTIDQFGRVRPAPR